MKNVFLDHICVHIVPLSNNKHPKLLIYNTSFLHQNPNRFSVKTTSEVFSSIYKNDQLIDKNDCQQIDNRLFVLVNNKPVGVVE